MTNNQRNDRDEARHLMVSGMVLIVASFLLGIFLVVAGCSGGHRKMPTDPAGSKPADQSPSTDQDATREGTVEWDWAMPYIEDLFSRGGGQDGILLAFQPAVFCAVFDSNTWLPIEGVYVSAGSDGSVVDATDVDGLVTLDVTALVTPNEPIYLTAGANGYVMQSDSSLLYNVYVFFLDTLIPPTPASATINGTVDFHTDDFYADVYSTNMISATDAVLEPSAPGDEDDTFEIKIAPDSTGHLYCTLRDTTTNDIISFKIVELKEPVAENDTLTLDFEYAPDPQGNLDGPLDPPDGDFTSLPLESELYDYLNNSIEYQSGYMLPYHEISPIDTISSSTSYFDSDFASYVPMSDTVIWTGDGTRKRTKYTTFLSLNIVPIGTLPNWIPEIPFPLTSALVMLDVTYEDGSGASLVWNVSDEVVQSLDNFIPEPPAIDSPTDGALGVTLNPTIDYSWDTEGIHLAGYYQIRLVDSVNANVWVIRLSLEDDGLSTQLPILPTEQESWGLTIGNEVLAVIGEVSQFPTNGIIPGSFIPLSIELSNHSGVYRFTP